VAEALKGSVRPSWPQKSCIAANLLGADPSAWSRRRAAQVAERGLNQLAPLSARVRSCRSFRLSPSPPVVHAGSWSSVARERWVRQIPGQLDQRLSGALHGAPRARLSFLQEMGLRAPAATGARACQPFELRPGRVKDAVIGRRHGPRPPTNHTSTHRFGAGKLNLINACRGGGGEALHLCGVLVPKSTAACRDGIKLLHEQLLIESDLGLHDPALCGPSCRG